jgi:hypothetical protein
VPRYPHVEYKIITIPRKVIMAEFLDYEGNILPGSVLPLMTNATAENPRSFSAARRYINSQDDGLTFSGNKISS